MAEKYDVSILFRLIDQLSGPAKKLVTNFDHIRKSADRLSKSVGSMGRDLSLKLTAPIIGLGLLAVKKAADMENLIMQFEVMLGSAEKAASVLKDLIGYADRTPFHLEGVANSARALLSMGVAQEKILPTLEMLGDISAGTGKDLNQLAIIYTQVKEAGRLMGQDYLQIMAAGIPLAKVFKDHFGKGFRHEESHVRGEDNL